MAANELDPEARRDLISLDKRTADLVARHLVMVSRLLDDAPEVALEHARAARKLATRVGVVRETAGIAAYAAGEWAEAISDLRAARRITGGDALLPLIADAERGLGKPERAIDIARSAEGRALTGVEGTEMRIVEAGARIDLGEPDKALVTLQREDLSPKRTGTAAARLFYAYAAALLAADRRDEALRWFMNAAAADVDDVTDAEDRIMELTDGEVSADGDLDDGSAALADPGSGSGVDEEVGVVEERAVEPVESAAAVAASDGDLVGVVEEQRAVADSGDVAGAHKAASSVAEGEVTVATVEVREPAHPVTGDEIVRPVEEVAAEPAPVDAPERSLAAAYDVLLLDLDGTVYTGAQAIPGASEALSGLSNPLYYVTNNASRRAPQVAEHLTELGFPTDGEHVVTSAQAGARLLSQYLQPGSLALVVGTDGLAQEVREVGIGVTRQAADRPAAVIQGHSPDTGWALLSEAALAIRAGARWIACNADPTLPSERGPLVGNGSMVAALKAATDQVPEIAGKPSAEIMNEAIDRSGARRPLMIGDRMDTDIEAGHSVNIDTLLVLTGITTPRELLAAPPEHRPTYVTADLTALRGPVDDGRIGERADWQVEPVDGGLKVSAVGEAAAAGLLPAIAHAVWTHQLDGATVTVTGGDETVSKALAELGL